MCTCFCSFECTVWRACKAPSRVQCVFLACGVRVRPSLVFSGSQKLHPLVFSVLLFLLLAAYTTPSKRETKKASPYCTCVSARQFSSTNNALPSSCLCICFPRASCISKAEERIWSARYAARERSRKKPTTFSAANSAATTYARRAPSSNG